MSLVKIPLVSETVVAEGKVYSFPRAAITKHLSPDGLDNRNIKISFYLFIYLFLAVLGGLNSGPCVC
jgi:hypothetical protein